MIKILAAAAVLASTGAAAQSITVFANSPEGLGANSIMNGDYVSAEKQIQSAAVSPFDPARQINLGVVLAMTGRGAEAQKLFHQVLVEDAVDVTVASGATISSHDAAERALNYFGEKAVALK
jgi:Flp pilus assembly protein TadD